MGRKARHGMWGEPEYGVWTSMLKRCRNPNDGSYRDYGGRGIRVCARWETFENFFEDMGRRPTPNHSIGREDVNGNYEPSNCRWATSKEQGRNRRNNRTVELNGRTVTIAEAAEELKLRFCFVRDNLHRDLIELAEEYHRNNPVQRARLGISKVKEIKRLLGSYTISDTAVLADTSLSTVKRIAKGEIYGEVSEFD